MGDARRAVNLRLCGWFGVPLEGDVREVEALALGREAVLHTPRRRPARRRVQAPLLRSPLRPLFRRGFPALGRIRSLPALGMEAQPVPALTAHLLPVPLYVGLAPLVLVGKLVVGPGSRTMKPGTTDDDHQRSGSHLNP